MVRSRCRLQILTEAEIASVHDTSLRVLEEIGVRVEGDRARSLLLDNGCQAGKDNLIRIRGSLVNKLLEVRVSEFTLYGRNQNQNITFGQNKVYAHNFGSVPTLTDIDSGERREATLEDLANLIRLKDALPNCHGVYPLVTPRDVEPRLTQVVTGAYLVRNTSKPLLVSTSDADETRYIVKILARVAGGERELQERPLGAVMLSPVSPLTFTAEVTEAILDTAAVGVPLLSLPCPICGLTAPMSLAGGLTSQNAESLAFFVLARLANPAVPLIYGARLGFADMKSGAAMDGRPDKGMTGACATQMAHFYGMPSDVYGMATAAHVSDIQSGYDKAISGLTAALAGADLVSGIGCVGHAILTNYEQVVIDNEIFDAVFKVLKGFEVNEDSLGLEVLKDVMLEGGNFLAQEHTRRYLRAGEIWKPEIGNLIGWEDWQKMDRESVVDRAKKRVKKILAEHQVVPLAAEVDRDIDAIMDECRRELVG